MLESFAACTDNSLNLCNISVTSTNAPSTDWVSEIPSLAFLIAIFRPFICAVIRSTIASPAASSEALLILLPDESRSIAVSNIESDSANDLIAVSELILVLTTSDMVSPP